MARIFKLATVRKSIEIEWREHDVEPECEDASYGSRLIGPDKRIPRAIFSKPVLVRLKARMLRPQRLVNPCYKDS